MFFRANWFSENYGEKVVELIGQAITIPDERKEVMEMCLASPPTGDFKPISLPSINPKRDTNPFYLSSKSACSPVAFHNSPGLTKGGHKHKPGKVGGGWDDDVQSDTGQIDEVYERHSQFR